MSDKAETAKDFYKRVQRDSANPEAQKAAAVIYEKIVTRETSDRQRGVKTRRSDWDLGAGVGPGGKSVVPIAEVCERRGINPPSNAVSSGLRPNNHRKPQTQKWGNDQLKT